jgi:hypothetical protein
MFGNTVANALHMACACFFLTVKLPIGMPG